MANGFDRGDNRQNGWDGFMLGLLTGTVVGVGLGMLFAPKAGKALRSQLSDQADTLVSTVSDGYRAATERVGQWADRGREAATDWATKGQDLYGKAREAAQSGADEARRYMRESETT